MLPMALVGALVAGALVPQDPLPATGKLIGVCRDATGKPVAGVKIEVRQDLSRIATYDYWRGAEAPSPLVARIRSGADGGFACEAPRGPEYVISFRKPGYKTAKVQAYVDRPFLGLLERGRDAPEEEAPKKTGGEAVRGRVVDTAGKPVAGAVLRAAWKLERLATSAADGGFQLARSSLPEETYLLAFASGYAVGAIAKTGFDGDKVPVLRIARGGTLVGRVVDDAGKGVEGLCVLAETDVLVSAEESYGSVPWTARTDAQGRYVLSGVATKGRYWVRTLLPDGRPLELGQGVAGKPSVDLGTTATGPTTSVSGKVTGKLVGDPARRRVHVLRLFDNKIAAWLVARETPSVPIDHRGEYRIPALAPGTYELAFICEKSEPEVRVVRAGPKGGALRLDVVVGVGRSFKGRVLDAEGKPVGGALLRAMPVAPNDLTPLVPPDNPTGHNGRFLVGNVRVLTREDGTFLLERIRSHLPIRLVVVKEGLGQKKLVVDPGGDETLEIRLERRR